MKNCFRTGASLYDVVCKQRNAPMSLHIDAGSHEPSVLHHAISTIIARAGSDSGVNRLHFITPDRWQSKFIILSTNVDENS